jgi:hypothetical protein
VIAANGIGALAAKAATTTVPILFATGSDPAAEWQSLNRPGGNVTGVSFLGGLVGGKRLELLHQLLPNASQFPPRAKARPSGTMRWPRRRCPGSSSSPPMSAAAAH